MTGRALRHIAAKMPVREPKSGITDSGDDSNQERDYVVRKSKVLSRELRNRFIISNGKRRLRLTNAEDGRKRNLRSCRVVTLGRGADYSLSQSDEDDDDDRMFTPMSARTKKLRLRHSQSRRESPIPARVKANNSASQNEDDGRKRSLRALSQSDEDDDDRIFTPMSSRDKTLLRSRTRLSMMTPPDFSGTRCNPLKSNNGASQNEDGIRRSTRVRKLKFDNYSDSWIVGSQTLRGYPSYTGPSYAETNIKAVKEEVEDVEEHEEEEDEEVVDQEEDNSRTGNEEDTGCIATRSRRRSQPGGSSRGKKNVNGTAKGEEDKGPESKPSKEDKEQQKEGKQPQGKPKKKEPSDGQEENSAAGGAGRRQEDRGAEASSESEERLSHLDMYARVKERRRRRQERVRAAGSSSDSESSSRDEDDEDDNRRRRQRNRDDNRVERKYHLRQTKPTVDRFQAAEPDKRRSARVLREVLNSVRRRRRRSSTSSSDDSPSSDDRFDRKKNKAKSRNRVLGARRLTAPSTPAKKSKPVKASEMVMKPGGVVDRLELAGSVGDDRGHHSHGGPSSRNAALADVRPLQLDRSIGFKQVGGLERVVDALKETVVFPVLYNEVFAKFGVTPPKGVLFHGPPGTGKTLVARALASECSMGDRKVSFFMRKGADCLSKWVGESERQLRLLFEEAKQARPSIIFFDELDGLAPVRSTKQDQIHASIVCTLLALMDGLDNRGDVVVIGATNRIDTIDPALRRPGRFDRELHFPLPGVKERREILEIHSNGWSDSATLNKMAEISAGYCGSDLKALCTESVIQALKRVYPQIYNSDQKLVLDPTRVKVDRRDFMKAFRGIIPASQRAAGAPGRKLPQFLEPLLGSQLGALIQYVTEVFPPAFNRNIIGLRMVRSPRLLLVGHSRHTMLLSLALLYKLEHCPIHSIGLETLYSESARSPEETITKIFKELPHSTGSVLWFGDISLWWASVSDSVKALFTSLVSLLDPALPILFIATSCTLEIPPELASLFSAYRGEVHMMEKYTRQQKEAFYRPLFRIQALRLPPPTKKKKEDLEPLQVAPPPPPPKMTEEQLLTIYHEEENTLRELRIFLRQICAKLARNKQFYMFSKPVDIKEVPDYLSIIKEPMDLETMMTKIDLHKYTCAQDFLNDIDLLCKNALEYNPDRDPADKLIRHRACFLRDTAYALIKAEMDSDFEVNCRMIRDSRKTRGDTAEERFTKEFFPIDDRPDGTAEVKEENESKSAFGAEGNAESTETSNFLDQSLCLQDDRGSADVPACPGQNPGKEAPATSSGNLPGIASSQEVRKRRKRSVWYKGCIGKKVAKKAGGDKGANGCLPSGSSNSQDQMETTPKQQADSEESSVQSKSKKPKLNTDENTSDGNVLVNGIGGESSNDEQPAEEGEAKAEKEDKLNESIDATELSFMTAATPSQEQEKGEVEEERILKVDRVELGKVLDEAVDSVESRNSLEALIDLYTGIRLVIDSFRRKWDRTDLPQALRRELAKFVEDCLPETDDDMVEEGNEENPTEEEAGDS